MTKKFSLLANYCEGYYPNALQVILFPLLYYCF